MTTLSSDKPGPKNQINMFGFMDESGLLRTSRTDPFFSLGLIKLQKPSFLHREIIKLKGKYTGEYKFRKVTNLNLRYYKLLIDKYMLLPQNS